MDQKNFVVARGRFLKAGKYLLNLGEGFDFGNAVRTFFYCEKLTVFLYLADLLKQESGACPYFENPDTRPPKKTLFSKMANDGLGSWKKSVLLWRKDFLFGLSDGLRINEIVSINLFAVCAPLFVNQSLNHSTFLTGPDEVFPLPRPAVRRDPGNLVRVLINPESCMATYMARCLLHYSK